MANTCGLINLSAVESCAEASGGLEKSAIIGCEDVTDFTLDSNGAISGITLSSTNLFALQEFDDDNTSKYDQNAVRDNKKVDVTQQALYKFAGLDATKTLFGQKLLKCCCLYAIHFLNNGEMLLQGIDVYEDTANPGTYLWKKSKTRCTADLDALTDTGENEDRLEIKLNSVGRTLSAPISMTRANVEALIMS